MNLNVEVSEDIAAVVTANAQAQGISPDRYVSQVLEITLARLPVPAVGPLKTGSGMWAKYGPAPSIDEIDEVRREMFQNFAQDV